MGNLSENKLIRLSKSCLKDAEKQAVMRVLDKEFLGMGEQVRIFEEKLSEFFQRPAVCVVNGTAALHLALQACEIGKGDEVIVPSITYVASYQAITATGATPVACDVEEDSCCLDIIDAEKRITDKTKAIMPVHYSGGVGQLDKIYYIAEKYNLRVVEDAAHAFGTIYKDRKIGSFGDISCFSFDGIKNITSGEGGCVVTDDNKVLDLIKDARLLGVEKDTDKRFKGDRSWSFDVKKQGWRYHMSDIMAAIGIEQLKRFDEISSKRMNLADHYNKKLIGNSGFRTLNLDYTKVVPHIYVVLLNQGYLREKIIDHLKQNGIQAGVHYQPNNLLTYFSEKSLVKGEAFQVTDRVANKLLTLPLHEDLSNEQLEFVVNKFKEAINTYGS